MTQAVIIGFTLTYLVALSVEASRLFIQRQPRRRLAAALTALALAVHTGFLLYRANLAIGAGYAPLSSIFDWYLFASWALAGFYLLIMLQQPQDALGMFLLPLILALLAVAIWFAERSPFTIDRASTVWRTIHSVFLGIGTVAVLVGFASGVMYLLHSYRLKRKLPQLPGLRLPSLESLEHLNSRAIILSLVTLSVGVLSGAILNLVRRNNAAQDLPWSDPIVWSSLITVAWLVAAALFLAFYRPARQGHKVAYLTLASFVFLAFCLAAGLFFPTEHRPRDNSMRPQPSATVQNTSHIRGEA